MKNVHTSYLILSILTLSIGQLPHLEASLLNTKINDMYSPSPVWTWGEARQACRSSDATHHSDLAIMRNETERNTVRHRCSFKKCQHTFSLNCWIGLRRDENDLSVWKWVNNETYKTSGWNYFEPGLQDMCVHLSCSQLFGSICSKTLHRFLCQVDNLILVKVKKTWEEAIDHCRTLQVDQWDDTSHANDADLLILHTSEEFAYAQNMIREAQMGEVWIGLRWLARQWLWMDGETEAGDSMPACPANGMNCGTLSEERKQARNCAEKRNFFCFHRL